MRKVFLVGFLLLLPCILAAQQQVINNDSVVRMTESGLSEVVIISAINTSPGVYDTSVDGLIDLQSAGVSEKVIAAIQAKAVAGAVPAAPAVNTRTTPSFDPKNTSQKVPIWVQVAGVTGGFTSANKELSDSVRDVQNRIKGSKTLSLAPTIQEALIIMEIVSRDTQVVDTTGIERTRNNQRKLTTTLIVRVIVGEFEEEFRANGNADSFIAWREAARSVVNNMERWVRDNRNQLANY